MRQLIESIIVFQAATSKYSPIHNWIPNTSVKLTPEQRRTKWIAYSVIFTLAFVAQCYFYTTNYRKPNFYEVLDLKPSATNLDIMRIESLNQTDFTAMQTRAFKCLTSTDCRSEYTRYGSDLQLNSQAQDFKFDWRLLFTVGFYMAISFIQGTLSTVEQKPGLRLSMGLGIIFCLSEVQILQDVQAQILDGQQPDARIKRMMAVFPETWCAFECIILLRVTFFALFNIINANSLCYVVDDTKAKIVVAKSIQKNQREITMSIQEIHNMQSTCQELSKKMRIREETLKPELVMLSNEYRRRMEKQIQELRQGKDNVKQTKWSTFKVKKWLRKIAIFGVLIGLAAQEIIPRVKVMLTEQ